MSADKLIKKALKEHNAGRLEAAKSSYRKILKRTPDHVDALYLLGTACAESGDYRAARPHLEAAAGLKPDSPFIQNNLGNVYLKLGGHKEASNCLEKALALDPKRTEARISLASLRNREQRYSESQHLLDQALAQEPESAAAWLTLGNAMRGLNLLIDAAGAYRKAAELATDPADALHNLGSTLTQCGEIQAAIEILEQILEDRPTHANAASDRLLAMNYGAHLSCQAVAQAHADWGKSIAVQALPPATTSREKRLRIGYVSADFNRHPVAQLLLPVLETHNKEKFEVHLFSTGQLSDQVTEQCRQACDRWWPAEGLSDKQLAKTIRDAKIDVLIDLAGHTAGNRLGLFAARPTKCQITYLGYPNTTGLKQMDFIISDSDLDPEPLKEDRYTERLLHLTGSLFCFRPGTDYPPPAPPPMLENGYSTLGIFTNLAKLSDPTIELASKILQQMPAMRLLMHAKAFADPGIASGTISRLKQKGIAEDRIELVGNLSFEEHLRLYARVDFCLDTYPWNGHMNTLNALWMGVPVLSVAGDSRASRMGRAIMRTAGLADLICDDETALIGSIRQLSSDPDAAATRRANQRAVLIASALCDVQGYTRALESAFERAAAEA